MQSESGDIYVQLSEVNDLVCFSPEMKEKSRIQGSKTIMLPSETTRYFNTSSCPNYLLYSKGNGNLFKLNLQSGETTEYPNFFWPKSKDKTVPLLVACHPSKEVIVGLSVSLDKNEVTLSIYEEFDLTTRHLNADLKMSSLGEICCLEIDNEGRSFIAGGSTSKHSDGIMAAYSLDKKSKEITMNLFSGYRCVSRIVRIPNMNKFIAATTNFIFIVEYINESKFNTIGTVRSINNNSSLHIMIVDDIISDIAIYENKIYVVYDKSDTMYTIKFKTI